ncbi:nucleotidyltransferase [Streptomyces sp. PKU-MA01144]|uniref:SMODS domain-containing nucleotidyltransferase n=1 Tax=Streptomyces TaxID=1883 RepID=UPI00147BB02C|nr:nucleotidyltransferase [Streptomyces sp. PKU-MA01144]
MDAQISAAFDQFYELITPPRWKAQEGLACARTISNYMRNSRQEVASYSFKQFRLIGSYARATAIREFSDVDVMFEFQSLTALDFLASRPLLAGIRDLLEQSTDSAIQISEMQEVVQVEYPGGLRLDILPAVRNDSQSYLIPDGRNGWRVTAPDVQKCYFSGRDAVSMIHLPEFTRGLKYWNAARGGLVRSYHLESIVAQLGPHLGDNYAIATRKAFERLSRTVKIMDPVGCQGELSVYLSTAQCEAIAALCRASAAESLVALKAQASGDCERALTAWASVYGPRFPSKSLG